MWYVSMKTEVPLVFPLSYSLNPVAQIMKGPYFATGTAMSAEVSFCVVRRKEAGIM